jgi:hypothetical protein
VKPSGSHQPLGQFAYVGFHDRAHSRQSFDIGSVTPQPPTQENLMAQAIESCAPVLAKVRHWLATLTSRAI